MEYITDNGVDLVITLNQSSQITFTKYSTNFELKGYKEKLVVEKDILKKEINFKYDALPLGVINFFSQTILNSKTSDHDYIFL